MRISDHLHSLICTHPSGGTGAECGNRTREYCDAAGCNMPVCLVHRKRWGQRTYCTMCYALSGALMRK